ncbi:MAG: Nif3-like dinuclear metal center hexameric protein [Gemmatimonadetes bacterium]|nr:Nif3-like dinuclear metal center hexameric protein [Gemmatimonadota bacterium]
MAKLEQILYFLEETFQTSAFPDYPDALNGLQVDGPAEVAVLGAAVDASEQTISAAVEQGVDLLLVHHGLFWDGPGAITGPRFRKVAALVHGGTGLFALHLPLDAHPELGNNVLLMDRLGLAPQGRFGYFKEEEIGWWAETEFHRDDLLTRLREVVGGECRLIPGGGAQTRRVGVVTGGGASVLREAAARGLDTLVTGEAPHHAYHESLEFGVNLLLGGHYATETFGVKALGARLAKDFGLDWKFLDFPTGL